MIVLAGASAYWNSLSGPFLFDDQLSIVANPQIRRVFSLGVFFPEREAPVAGRPLVNISFAINYALGRLDVRGYHAWNIATHLLCALVLFAVVRRTLELPSLRPRAGRWSGQAAFATAIIWVVHPLNTEAVNYLTERTESMMGLFYFLTLHASIRARTSARTATWTAAAVLSCAGGMACKESMATAPLVVVLYDRIFLFGSLREALRSRWRLYAGLAATWLELAALMSSGPRVHSAGFSTPIGPWTYLLNQTDMIVRYLQLSAWPRALVLNYGPPRALTLADVALHAALVGGLLLMTVAALTVRPKVGFLGAWFFVTLAPASSVVPIATEVGAERRMYLPLTALVALAVVGGALLWERIERVRLRGAGAKTPRLAAPGATLALALVVTALVARTMARNREYSSGVSIARTVLERYPTSVAHRMVGTELALAGQRAEAVAHLREATRGEPRAYFNLGVELYKDGKLDESIEQLQQFVTREPLLLEVIEARTTLGRAFAKQEKWAQAVEQYRLVLRMAPSYVEVQGLLADALAGQKSFDEAIVQYRGYLQRRPDNADAWGNLGIALASIGKPDDAVSAFRRALEIRPQAWDAHRNLANALLNTSAFDDAASHAEQAVRLKPDDPVSHELFGLALAGQGKFDAAKAELERSLELDPSNAATREELERLLTAPRRATRAGSGRP